MSASEVALRWLLAFAVTQAIECPIYIRGFRVRPAVAFGASLATHPIVCLVIPRIWRWIFVRLLPRLPLWAIGRDAYFVGYGALAESFAIVFEAAFVAWLGWPGGVPALEGPRWMQRPLARGALASVVANTASGLVGLALSGLTGWP